MPGRTIWSSCTKISFQEGINKKFNTYESVDDKSLSSAFVAKTKKNKKNSGVKQLNEHLRLADSNWKPFDTFERNVLNNKKIYK